MSVQRTKLWRVHAEKIAEDFLAAIGIGRNAAVPISVLVEAIGQTVEIVEDDPNFDISDGVVVKFDDWNLQEKWFIAEIPVLEELVDRIIIECDTKDVESMADAWQWFVEEHLYPGGKQGTRARSLEFVMAETLRGERVFLDYNNPRESATEIKEELDSAKD